MAPRIPGLDEVHVAEEQEEHQTLVASPVEFQDGTRGLLTRWRFSAEELHALALGSDLYLTVLTYGLPLQPLELTVGQPEWATPSPERGDDDG